MSRDPRFKDAEGSTACSAVDMYSPASVTMHFWLSDSAYACSPMLPSDAMHVHPCYHSDAMHVHPCYSLMHCCVSVEFHAQSDALLWLSRISCIAEDCCSCFMHSPDQHLLSAPGLVTVFGAARRGRLSLQHLAGAAPWLPTPILAAHPYAYTNECHFYYSPNGVCLASSLNELEDSYAGHSSAQSCTCNVHKLTVFCCKIVGVCAS